MLFKLEESGFILCICLILLTSGIIMYYFHTRVSMIENSVSKQNQVLADFFSTVQNDLRSNTLGHDIHVSSTKSSEIVGGGKKDSIGSVTKNSKIEVSDDEGHDNDDESGIKVVKVSRSADNSDSDSDFVSDTDLDLDLDSDTESDKEEDESKSTKESTNDVTQRKTDRHNEMAITAIEELVEEKEKLNNDTSKLDIKEIFLSNNFHGNTSDLNSSSGLSSLMLMISSGQSIVNSKDKRGIDLKDSKACVIEDVTDSITSSNADKNSINEMQVQLHGESSSNDSDKKTSLGDELDSGLTSVKKMKIAKLSANTSNSSEKDNNAKKETVAELRNKVVLMGLVNREESAKLKKSELLELINKNTSESTMSNL